MMERTRWQRSGMFAAALLLAAPDAFACSPIIRKMSPAQVQDYARAEYAKATAVLDAEVDLPMSSGAGMGPGLMPAGTLRVIRSYKGGQSPGEIIAMVYFSSCDIPFFRKGERIRVLLMGGPDLFRADQLANGPAVEGEGAQLEFNAEIDRLARTPRPAGFSTYPSEIDPNADSPASASGNASVTAANPWPEPIFRQARAETSIAVYLVGALGALLTFLLGVLIGRRWRRAA